MRVIAYLVVAAFCGLSTPALGDTWNLNATAKKATDYADRGASYALEFNYPEACKWYALAVALGGTDFKRLLDGVRVLLKESEASECIERAREWRPSPPPSAAEIACIEERSAQCPGAKCDERAGNEWEDCFAEDLQCRSRIKEECSIGAEQAR